MGNRRVLLAWENGAGLGHAKRILLIARGLQQRGYLPVVAAREIGSAQVEYRSAGIQVLQAPIHRGFMGDARNYRAQGFADIMASCAWDDPEALYAAVHAWDGLLELIRPALVVADYCPILPLATLNRYPLLVFGDGFVVPPAEATSLPLLRLLDAPRANDDHLIENGQVVLRARGDVSTRIRSLGALMNGDRAVVCTFPELDVYAAQRGSRPAVGPLERQRFMPMLGTGYLFVYLAAGYEHTALAMEGASEAGLPVRAFIRGAQTEQREAWRARGIFVHDTAPDLMIELQGAKAIMHHGGIGTMEAALAAGRPQLLLPRHLEQSLNAKKLSASSIAVRLAPPFKSHHAQAAVLHVMQSAPLHDKAQVLARKIAERPGKTGLEVILENCERIISASALRA